MKKTVVLNVVGLSRSLIGKHTPNIAGFCKGSEQASIAPMLPGLTCSVQSTYLTGEWPSVHGIVGNGWFDREDMEVKFWKQSDRLVGSPRIWDYLKAMDPKFTCANMFWWYNMYSSAEISVTPRPMYPADGRKLPDIYTQPAGLRDYLQEKLGQFPLFSFWGPMTGIRSSEWIADASIEVDQIHDPTLTLIYLPHLDYVLQRSGPAMAAGDLEELDRVVGKLLSYYETKGASVVILSEYGIGEVDQVVHINRMFRMQGWLKVREELGRELLDPGASSVFAVADHQIAHVYLKDLKMLPAVKAMLEPCEGIEQVLYGAALADSHLSHQRSGDLVVVAKSNAWFSYYYWTEDSKAPDFARTVDIHRKPGYDPVELFIDPAMLWPKGYVALKLLKKKLGFRTLMDVIPLDAGLVRGSHGHKPESEDLYPVWISNTKGLLSDALLQPTEVFDYLGLMVSGQGIKRGHHIAQKEVSKVKKIR